MKRIVASILCIMFVLMLTGCGSDKTINGVKYGTYGLFNKSEQRNDDIAYKLIVGNLVWSIILVETIIAPIYFIGFSMYEPVGANNNTKIKGAVE